MINRIDECPSRGIIPDVEHGRELPYPIRTFSDEGNAYRYFLARYRNFFHEFEKTDSANELWGKKADLLAIIHSFSTPKSQPDMDERECIATIDALFFQVCMESFFVPKDNPGVSGTRVRL